MNIAFLLYSVKQKHVMNTQRKYHKLEIVMMCFIEFHFTPRTKNPTIFPFTLHFISRKVQDTWTIRTQFRPAHSFHENSAQSNIYALSRFRMCCSERLGMRRISFFVVMSITLIVSASP